MLDRLRARFGWLDTALAGARAGGCGRRRSAVVVDRAGGVPVAVPAAARGDRRARVHLGRATPTSPAEVVDQLGLTGSAADQVLDALRHAPRTAGGPPRSSASSACCGPGLGVVGTLEQALNATWQVKGRPGLEGQADRPGVAGGGRPRLPRLDGARARAPASCPGRPSIPTVVLGLVVDVVLFLWMFRALTNVSVPWRDHLPGRGGWAASALEVLKLVGTVYVPRAVSLGVGAVRLARRRVRHPRLAGDRRRGWSSTRSAFNVVRHEQAHGTVTVEIEVPHIVGEVPLAADRGGAVRGDAGRSRRPAARARPRPLRRRSTTSLR